MKIKKLLVMTFLSLMAATGANAQQPYGGCWHPEDIRNWSPETDPDAKFNRSMVPLAKRFKEPELMKANKHQFYEGQICNATILFPTCSMCPSQGATTSSATSPLTGSTWTSLSTGQARQARASSFLLPQALRTPRTRAE